MKWFILPLKSDFFTSVDSGDLNWSTKSLHFIGGPDFRKYGKPRTPTYIKLLGKRKRKSFANKLRIVGVYGGAKKVLTDVVFFSYDNHSSYLR